MMQAPDLPLWAAIITGLTVIVGALFTLIGTLGLFRLGNFFERIHAPTLGTTFGIGFILVGSVVALSVLQNRPIVHEILLLLFVTVTTPVTLMSLGRAALFRKNRGK